MRRGLQDRWKAVFFYKKVLVVGFLSIDFFPLMEMLNPPLIQIKSCFDFCPKCSADCGDGKTFSSGYFRQTLSLNLPPL